MAPTSGCYYASMSGTDTFTISSHFVHVGQRGTVTYPTGQWNLNPVQGSPGTAYNASYLGYGYGFGYYASGPC